MTGYCFLTRNCRDQEHDNEHSMKGCFGEDTGIRDEEEKWKKIGRGSR